jgi:N-acetylglucosamine-6-phosphate deacetylase
MLNRAPGVVGAAINSDAYAGLICDGIHVDYEMLGLAIRARSVPDRMFLVSDAMPTIGGSGEFQLYDMKVHLEEGRLVNDEGSLAGAHITMAESVVRAVAQVGVSLEEALRMAITIPARVIGQPERAALVGMAAADLIVLDKTGQLVTGPDEAPH